MYTYKFKLKPTTNQQVLLNKHFGATRFLYNRFLEERKTAYQNDKKSLNYYDNSKELTAMKKTDEYGWLKECNSQSLQYSLKQLDSSFNNFFRKLGGFPKFHSRYSTQGFRVPQKFTVDDNRLRMPKFRGGIKVTQDREVQGELKFCTITKDAAGDYFVSVTTDHKPSELSNSQNSVGIDLGIKDLMIMSDGTKVKNKQYYRKLQKKLGAQQKELSRKEKGSNRRKKARVQVAKTHRKIANRRKDTIHKATINIIRNNQLIVMEDLNVKGMVKNHRLAKSVSDASFGEIKRQLQYKSEWYGRSFVQIGRWYPSSKTCNNCGYINQNLMLSERTWECPQCATKLDRDLNASKNILDEGLRSISSGVGATLRGAEIRLDELSVLKASAVKRETVTSLGGR